jgi:hypothetical protein
MIENVPLPPELNDIIGSEKPDFVLESKGFYITGTSKYLILFGLAICLWSISDLVYNFLRLFQGKEAYFYSNFLTHFHFERVSPDHLEQATSAVVFAGALIVAGIVLLVLGIKPLFKNNGIFLSTSTRLIHLQKSKINSIQWKEFADGTKIGGREKNVVVLKMKTGPLPMSRFDPHRTFLNEVCICGVSDAIAVAKICAKRIIENTTISV